ncbi:zinc finger CCCH domain-containing protein 19-like [Primulina huaijiensis]|uniref:zinc finger CCCH domain-containing protein 19-like n=1 Tax=Primulina huaijiensis TaxID=1492673 RepID=UPI003CC710CB
MEDDENAFPNLQKAPESDLERETFETGDEKIAEECEFLLESGEWNGMFSSEAVADKVGGKAGLEDNAAAESRVVMAVVPVEELTEEGGGEVMISDVEDRQLKRKPDEGTGILDDSKVASAVSDAGNSVLFSEPKVDAREDEFSVEPNLGMATEEEFMTIANSEVEAVVPDADEAPAFSGSPEYVRGDECLAASEGMEFLNDRAELVMESVISEEEKVEEVGAQVDFAHCGDFENDLEVVVVGGEDREDKVDFMENYLEAGIAEKSSCVKEEKVDLFITKETPITDVNVELELITEVDTNLVNFREHEEVLESSGTDLRDKLAGNEEVSAEEKLMSETEMVEEKCICEDSVKDFKLIESVIAAENRDVAVVDEEFPAGNSGMEIDERVESDVFCNDVSMEAQLEGAEVETWTTSLAVTDKIHSDNTITVVTDPDQEMDDSPAALQDKEDEKIMDEEATEIETETEVAESRIASEGKRKRGKFLRSSSISKVTTKASSRKKVGEDVCFICFDSGELVLCGRRGCPKAYHPSCVNRDEAFFRAKGRWNCGWHMCSICEKNAVFMCYTCTFSLCKRCSKDVIISCVRGNKGFCEICKRTVMLIENHEQGKTDIQNQIDFDDRGGWEYLFKHYYIQLKSKLSLSSVEVAEAKNPWKGSNAFSSLSKQGSSEAQADENDEGSGSDISIENLNAIKAKRRKLEKKPKSLTKEKELVSAGDVTGDKVLSSAGSSEWASKELLEFVSHMKNGDISKLSQFDVQELLLEYIKRNKLRDPRRKSQIVCDARLEIIFGKPRVGHFEMLKLLDSHFLIRDEQNEDVQESAICIENNQLDADGNADHLTKGGKDGRRKIRKKGIWGPQSNLDDYAAIDIHNISLIYLHRKLMEDLLEDVQTFHDKVIGVFVRIRISGSIQKQDMYRLVQVVGTSKAEEPYKIGKRTTDTLVEILNLDKIEVISVDTISNQEFTEEECKRLRQSIKCGLISRLTVGEILDKTKEIQAVKVNDWLESEIVRLSHLRDRASDLGHQKELKECVEKLQILKTPEDRDRRLKEIPEIHSDPRMDPSYESDDSNHETEDSRQDDFWRSRGSSVSTRVKDRISPEGDDPVNDSWGSPVKISPKKLELSRSVSGDDFSANAPCGGEMVNENCRNSETDREPQKANNLEKLSSANPMSAELRRSVCDNDFSANAPCGGEMVNGNCHNSEDREPQKSDNLEKLGSANPMSAELSRSVSGNDFSANAPGGGEMVNENCRNLETDGEPLKSNNLEKLSSANSMSAELSRSVSGNDFSANATCVGEMVNGNCINSETDGEPQKSNNLEKVSSANSKSADRTMNAASEADSLSGVASLTSQASLPAGVAEISIKVNDRKKIWHYQDPSGKVQGPFSMARLRKWNNAGYFPSDLRIWRTTEEQDHSILISNALVGKFQAELPAVDHMIPPVDTLHTTSLNHGQVIPTVDQNSRSIAKFSTEKRTGNAVTNIPIPMSALGNASWTEGEGDLPSGAIQSPGVKGIVSSPTAILRDMEHHSAVHCSANFNPTLPMPQQGILVGSADSLHLQPTISSEPHAVQMNLHPPIMVQSVQQVSSQSPLAETQGWSSTAQSGQPQEYGWTAPVQNSAPSLVNQSTTAGPQSEFWRPNQGSQPNIYPHATPNASWGIAPAENNAPSGVRPEILNTGWGMQQANPNMGLGNPSAGNTNTNRGHPVQAPPRGNANSSWVAPTTNAGANTQGPMPGNVNSGWTPTQGWGGPPVERPVSGNRWGPSGSRPPVEVSAQGTSNQGWGAPQGNHGAWGGEQNHNEGQFSGQMNGQGRDSVFGGGSRPWNRQPTFGGGRGGNQHFNKRDVLCPYNAYGRCRKGAHCDYLHV